MTFVHHKIITKSSNSKDNLITKIRAAQKGLNSVIEEKRFINTLKTSASQYFYRLLEIEVEIDLFRIKIDELLDQFFEIND